MTPSPPNDQGEAIDDAEWQAQERAMHALRDCAEPGCGTHAGAGYPHIAQALREPPSIDLPVDFAVNVARLALSQAYRRPAGTDADFRIAGMLAGVLLVCCVLAGFRYAHVLHVFLASPAGFWTTASLCCAAAAQAFQLLTSRPAGGFGAGFRG